MERSKAMPMKILSVNVGLPREILHEGRSIRTGIFKVPVEGRVHVAALNLAGDKQADLTVHGGPSKAVYAYPAVHYAFWRKELPGVDFRSTEDDSVRGHGRSLIDNLRCM